MVRSKLLRMDNVGIVVEDLKSAISFFEEIGFSLDAEMPVAGDWVDRIVGLKNVKNDIAMMSTPDGHSKLELMKFKNPEARSTNTDVPVNTLGIRRIMFTVDNLRELLGRLQIKGAQLIGEVVQYENAYLLCYLKGPEGIIVALAEPLADGI